jgi:DNA-directed RNA polymerase subunit RPC12/RpoP
VPKRLPDNASLRCPGCGADRLIPLTFPVYKRDAGPEVHVRRPVANCFGCGERIFAHTVYRQVAPKPG